MEVNYFVLESVIKFVGIVIFFGKKFLFKNLIIRLVFC